jgi:hypothetical protein
LALGTWFLCFPVVATLATYHYSSVQLMLPYWLGLATYAGSIAWMLIWLVKQAKQVQTDTVRTREHGMSRSSPQSRFCNGVAKNEIVGDERCQR